MIFQGAQGDVSLRREEIYRHLRRDILACAFAPGVELHEPALAERFSVSKSPIRDALLRLEAEGLVVVRPRKGYRVAPVSVADARDLFDFRALVEQACAAKVAENAPENALRALDRFRALDGWAGRSFPEYNREFHLTVASLCDNRRMARSAVNLIEQFDRLVIMSIKMLEDADVGPLVDEHSEILDALQARAGRKAGRLMASHVSRAKTRVIAALSQAAAVS